MTTDLHAVFADLREILRKHAAGMIVVADTAGDFTITSPAVVSGKPLWFGRVMVTKSAVSYYLFPLYFNPRLQSAIPAELLPRKQGKTCFNFRRADPELFARLDTLTGQAREAFERHGMLKPGPVAAETLNAALRAGGEDPEALAKLRKSKGEAAARKRAATLRKKRAASRD
jgi:hypothetical protein